jgi:hypothetical protein
MTSIAATRPTPKMRRKTPIRFIVATILSASALLHAQPQAASKSPALASSTLPATAPTPTPAPVPLTPAQSPPQRPKVTYTDNEITVAANNSSLNQILHDISRLTGIKITGGVVDERVFGDYGPASPSQVLATLLNGTGSNMLLVQSTGNAPTELILTPRQGGATPPNPNAQSFDDSSESSEDAPSNPVPRTIRHQPPSPYPARPTPSPDSTPQTDETPTPAAQNDATAQPTSPNGVKTPQQIYDELQRVRQQQSKPQE